MLCCLNPDCPKPYNPDTNQFCQTCSAPLTLLRGHYRVTQILSTEGGFGRTYIAEDVDKLNEPCVVKQLVPQNKATWAIKKSIELFEEEAKQLQNMGEHPQIPTMYAYFEENHFFYLVQQWIDGETLEQLARRGGGWQEAEIRYFLLDILPVLQFIHSRSVVHRDLKPSNIMHRRSDGKFVLIDFGASKQFINTTEAIQGTKIGTFGYAPIEQMQGGETYPASDLFSMGAICFYLLTKSDPADLFIKHGYDWVTNWQQHLSTPISTQLIKVIDKLLQIERQHRYQSAVEVLKDLGTKQLPTLPNLSISLPNNQKLKDSLRTGVIILSLIAGGFLLGIFGFLLWKLQPNQQVINQSENTASIYLSPVLTLTGHSDRITSIAISPDGKTLASGSADRNIKLWNLFTGKELRTLKDHAAFVTSVDFSKDGKTLASGSGDKTIKLWNVADGKELFTIAQISAFVWAIAFTPDGITLASTSGNYVDGNDNLIQLWNLTNKQNIRSFQGHSSYISSIAISPDGQTIASGSWDKTIKLWNLASGREIFTFKGHTDKVNSLAFTPDGLVLTSGSTDKTIKLWNVKTGEEIATLKGDSSSVTSLAISPNGKILASGSLDKIIRLWSWETRQEIAILKGHSDRVYSLAFSPNGKLLASGSKDVTIKIWQIPEY
ncbi:protein kinase [Aerosakkonemataceae cyanobacterium BLCC-F154]|uniref:Protein kinase n=1 Tax=Floridaenema fluviatile BLCC-F154 TaxID=3153640 RepID=A0ABV4Y8B8_9CYAN